MSEREIRSAGLAIDVPFESGSPDLERLEYADLGADKKWDAPEGWENNFEQPSGVTDSEEGGPGDGATT